MYHDKNGKQTVAGILTNAARMEGFEMEGDF